MRLKAFRKTDNTSILGQVKKDMAGPETGALHQTFASVILYASEVYWLSRD